MAIEKVLQEALALSEEDREKLLVALHRSFEPDDGDFLAQEEWDRAWAAEIHQRMQDLEEGRATTYSHEEVMAKARASIRR